MHDGHAPLNPAYDTPTPSVSFLKRLCFRQRPTAQAFDGALPIAINLGVAAIAGMLAAALSMLVLG